MSTARWGIISTANIGTEKVIPGIQKAPSCTVTAIASRDAARAREAADRLGIDKAYGSYEELLADPDIDCVYNPLPNHLHVPLTLQAAAAGKHVLCEKPVALDADEARQLLDAPDGILILEAFMVRFHPQFLRAREIVRSGRLGELRAVQAFFSYFNDDPDNIRNMADIGGGALMDIGCYPMVTARFFFESEPQRVIALIDRDPTFRTDRLSSGLMDFGDGRRLDFTVSTQLTPYQRVNLVGTKARLEIMIPYNAPQGQAETIRVDDGSKLADASAVSEVLPAADQYAEQAEAFARAVLDGTGLPYGPADAVQNMAILDALFRSEKSGTWETV